MSRLFATLIGGLLSFAMVWLLVSTNNQSMSEAIPEGREEVVFWHFWGGQDRPVVEDVVQRFNQSQDRYFVRAVAMPGKNLQAKLFLAVAGGDPPDLVNQDDPVLADWAYRGVIQPIVQVAPAEEVAAVRNWMLDSAERLSTYNDRMVGICNGLDIRLLYYNQSWLDEYDLRPPETIEQLDLIAETIATAGDGPYSQYGYLPDTRRLWAWGFVFGGQFYDRQNDRVTVSSPSIEAALKWMASYRQRYGADAIAAFRKGDQSLPGAPFPLLPIDQESMRGRYAVIMDGQWRVRDLDEYQQNRKQQGLAVPQFGVCPLPPPAEDGRQRAGWVNGNFFVVPRNARQPQGAWEFAKFWIGYTDPAEAAKTCAAGGWIPVSDAVVQTEEFQSYLNDHPLFRTFVDTAASENQFPVPSVVGASMFKRTVEDAAYEAMFAPPRPVEEILADTQQRIQRHLDRVGPQGGKAP